MRKPTRKQLQSTTALDDTVPTPGIGDNSGNVPAPVPSPEPTPEPPLAGVELPSQEVTHHAIETTLAAIMEHEKQTDYQRQKLARLLEDRHALLVATKEPGAVWFPQDIAEDQAKFDVYLTDLTAEFTLADPAKLATMDKNAQISYNNRMRARLGRALRLFINTVWLRTYRPSDVCRWNETDGRWELSPHAFIPFGHTGGGQLIFEKDGRTPRTFIPLENIDAADSYWVQKGKSGNVTINVSLDQLDFAVSSHIQAKRNPATADSEATPRRASRAARQPAATPATTPAEADVEAEDSDTPEATAPGAQADRVWALTNLLKVLVAADKFLNMDVLADLSWTDITLDGVNALTTIGMAIDRMNAKPDGVKDAPSVAAKIKRAA